MHKHSFFERLETIAYRARKRIAPSVIQHPLPWMRVLRLIGLQTFLLSGLPLPQNSWHRLRFPHLKGSVNEMKEPWMFVSRHANIPTMRFHGGLLQGAVPSLDQGRLTSLKTLLAGEESSLLWCRDCFIPSFSRPLPLTTIFDGAFPDLSTALFADGAALHLSGSASLCLVDTPAPSSIYPMDVGQHIQHVMCLEKGSRLLLIEDMTQGGGQFSNSTTRIVLKSGASMMHIRILSSMGKTQKNKDESIGINSALVSMEEDTSYRAVNWVTDASFSRLQSCILLNGERANAHVSNILIDCPDSQNSSMVQMYHRAPQTTSRQESRALMSSGFGLLHGTTHVDPMMKDSRAHQLFRGILLHPSAFLEVQPHLNIMHGDVECTHGAAVGFLDEQALFYLSQRGFDDATSRTLLCEAFLKEGLLANNILGVSLEPIFHELITRV